MDPSIKPLIDYIDQHRRQGFTDQQIRDSALQSGWPPSYVDSAFQQAASSAMPQSFPATNALGAQAIDQVPGESTTTNPAVNEQISPISAAPQKYRVFRAVIDTFKALRHNWQAFIVTTIASYLLFIGLIVLTIPLAYGLMSAMGVFGLIVVLIIFSALGVYGSGIVLVVQAQTLFDGIHHQKSAILKTIKQSFVKLPRVALACLLMGLAVYGPLILLLILGLLFALRSSSASMMLTVFSLGGAVWAIIGLLRFSLAPFVAFFEPELPIKRTLNRSYQLLKGGGQWFIIKGVFLLLALMIIISAMAGIENSDQLQDSDNPVVNITLAILSIIASGSMVMLYVNRRQVKGDAQSSAPKTS
ncbi:MAG: hypothetical protein KIH63_005110 [Candidatus Saccharibacteria bacterium]|nr:hypothetical protein [Candidatus Saccharibacteria bacterium]